MDGDVENFDVIGVHGSINIRRICWNNGFWSLSTSNNIDDIHMNAYLKNCDVSYEIGLINSYTLYQCK